MWVYEKKLQFPVKIKRTDPATAKLIMAQLGGPYCIWYLYVKCRVLVAFS